MEKFEGAWLLSMRAIEEKVSRSHAWMNQAIRKSGFPRPIRLRVASSGLPSKINRIRSALCARLDAHRADALDGRAGRSR